MNHGTEQRIAEERDRPEIRKPVKTVLISLGLIVGFLSHWLGPWTMSSTVVAMAIIVPTIGYRKYWHQSWFWMTIAALAVLQVPAAILARPLIDRFRFVFMLPFGLVD